MEFLIILAIILVIAFLFWGDKSIVTSRIEYKNSKIPSEFNGFKITQVSDLHNTYFGKNHKNLLSKIKNTNPDIIVVTGDIIDRRRYHPEVAIEFLQQAIQVAPVYYVTGNHEAWSHKFGELEPQIIGCKVKLLNNEKEAIQKGAQTLEIVGFSDPGFLTCGHRQPTNTSVMQAYLKTLQDNDNFKVMLCHRPELFEIYAKYNVDLTLTGHAHGGQVRLPFIGGLYSPSQGVFPKYTKGEYKIGNSSMIVSRGLGNSRMPIRLFNRPEIVSITLKS